MSFLGRFLQPGFRTTTGAFATQRAPFVLRKHAFFSSSSRPSIRLKASRPRYYHTSQPQQAYRRQAFNYQTFQGAQYLFSRWAARPTFYREVGLLAGGTATLYVANLEKVPVSDRYRFRIIPYSWEAWQGQQMYQQTMQEFGRKLMPPTSREHRMVQAVMERLIPHSGLEAEEWEVHVIDDPMKNAFVIPGGKVFVFRGILDVAQGEDGLAAVLGHEIAHNVAHHAAERMSQSVPVLFLLAVLSLVGLDPGIGNTALNLAFTLPGSRKQEEEADYIGLMMMSESCFDPKAAMGLWGRMEEEEKGASGPQFLSTHPSNHNRLEKIRGWLPKAEEKVEGSGCGMLRGYANEFRQQTGLVRW
ncbi:metalloendopeptidase [Recurvomyces mirabilis]|uniref:Metalloendopeptidase n=1 Tax=Recurvomyces mirabilis TaxID=574656 RepID=A0AAE0TQP5_9PEZI|nr:metalloendopeptidase [Recurvomyces mirabilis]KAK5150617.1 metalloendopeptidase [Recurvomyces mirabilis]